MLLDIANELKGGQNSMINQADISEGYEAISNGGTLSKVRESLAP
jgi:hypothetical protein